MRVRPARLEDAERLLTWRNDPETRRASFSTEAIARPDHLAWLARRLADPGVALLVGEEPDGVPVGQVRLDRAGDAALVSIVVAPEARGRGVGARLLGAAVRDRPLPVPVRALRAEVRPDNPASLRIFAHAGFAEVARDARAVRLERPLD